MLKAESYLNLSVHPWNNFQAVGTRTSTPSLSKHGKPLTKQPEQISLWQKTNYTRKRRGLPMHDDLFTHRELHARVSASHDLCLYGLDLFLGKKQPGSGANPVPTPSPHVSLIRVSHDS